MEEVSLPGSKAWPLPSTGGGEKGLQLPVLHMASAARSNRASGQPQHHQGNSGDAQRGGGSGGFPTGTSETPSCWHSCTQQVTYRNNWPCLASCRGHRAAAKPKTRATVRIQGRGRKCWHTQLTGSQGCDRSI